MDRETITTRAHGIDISAHQIFRGGTKAQDRGYDPANTWGQTDFAIAKIGEGINTPYKTREGANDGERDFMLLWEGVSKIGIRGVYFYQRDGYSWEQQADTVLNYIVSAKLNLHALWLDVEKINNVNSFGRFSGSFFADTWRILDRWKKNAPSGVTIGLYANPDVIDNYLVPFGMKNYGKTWVDEIMAYPQWLAQYWMFASPDKQPRTYRGYSNWDIWQYTDKGDSFGADKITRHYGSPDLNVYNGKVAEMKAWLKIGDTLPPPTDPPTPPAPPPAEPVTVSSVTVKLSNGNEVTLK